MGAGGVDDDDPKCFTQYQDLVNDTPLVYTNTQYHDGVKL